MGIALVSMVSITIISTTTVIDRGGFLTSSLYCRHRLVDNGRLDFGSFLADSDSTIIVDGVGTSTGDYKIKISGRQPKSKRKLYPEGVF